ncbi:MAG: chromate transporter [Fidelibacterota bacterium]
MLNDSNSEGEKHNRKNSVPFGLIFLTYFRIGMFTLGGGLAMATVMRHELVLKRKWISDREFIKEMSTATLVPGAIAMNFAYLQGRRLRGKSGAMMAMLGTVLPSFFIILLIYFVALPYFNYPRVAAFLHGCAVAVSAQLAFTVYVFGRKHLRYWQNIIVFIVGVVIVLGLKFHPIWSIIGSGVLGYFLCKHPE